MVHERCVRSILYRIVYVLNHLRRVIIAPLEPAAGIFERVVVLFPHVVEGDPSIRGWKIRGIALVVCVSVRASSDAIVGIVDTLACATTRVKGQRAVDLRVGRCVLEIVLARECDSQRNDNNKDNCGDGSSSKYHTFTFPTPAAAATSPAVVLIISPPASMLLRFSVVVRWHMLRIKPAGVSSSISFLSRIVLPGRARSSSLVVLKRRGREVV